MKTIDIRFNLAELTIHKLHAITRTVIDHITELEDFISKNGDEFLQGSFENRYTDRLNYYKELLELIKHEINLRRFKIPSQPYIRNNTEPKPKELHKSSIAKIKRKEMIFDAIKANDFLTNKEVSEITGINPSTTQHLIKEMFHLDVLDRIVERVLNTNSNKNVVKHYYHIKE